jgi:hypothetical protein
MSGGYVSCGKWLGDDKSCTEFLPLLEALEDLVTAAERKAWEKNVAGPIRGSLEALSEDDLPYFRLAPAAAALLAGVAARFLERSKRKKDESLRRCAEDLVRAAAKSKATGKKVVIHYD